MFLTANKFYNSEFCNKNCLTGLDKPRGFQEVEAPRISTQFAHEGGKVVSQTHWQPLHQERFLVLIFVRGWVDSRVIALPEVLSQRKISKILLGFEPETFRLEWQCLNQLRYRVPQNTTVCFEIILCLQLNQHEKGPFLKFTVLT